MRVAIFMEDGIINDIISDGELEVVFIDRDVEGVEEDEVKTVTGEDAYVFTREGHEDAKELNDIWKEATSGGSIDE